MSNVRPSEIPETAPTIGSGRYYVVNRLGEGGMAGVYRAWDQRLRVWRAVKVLFPQYSRREQIRRRFTAEARAMARLEHDNLVRMYDVEEDGELPFLVMELVMGGNLHDWVQRHGPMAPRLACQVTRQVTAGVGAAHQAGIVHRDVKPQNVLIAPNGVCKLTDFGVALQSGHELTREGVALGTRGYMAPEQYGDAANVDVRADIFSLGATLWTLLTAELPTDLFNVSGKPQLLEKIPAPLRSVIRVCCSASPTDRLKRADSLDRALYTAMTQLPPDAATAVPLTVDLEVHEPIGAYPDFPEIRQILEWNEKTERHLGRRGTPSSAKAPARAASPADPEDDKVTPLIPYVMPNVQGKATPLRERYRQDEGDVPEYIDPEAMALAPSLPPALRELEGSQPQITQQVVAPSPAAVSATPVPVPPVKTITPAPPPPRSSPPPRNAAWPPADEPAESPWGRTVSLAAFASLAMIMVLLTMLGGVTLVARNQVLSATTELALARRDVHSALQDVVGLISAIPADGRQPIEVTYLEYEEAVEEPVKIQAAIRLLDELDRALPRVSMNPSESGSTAALASEARKLRAVRSRYEQALVNWRSRKVGFPSSLFVNLGWARLPPEDQPRSW